jgi:putative DNA primase/helicase
LSNLELVLSKIPGYRERTPGQFEAKCPAHDDKRASLGVRLGGNGWVAIYCQAGCDRSEVLSKLGLRTSDIGPPRSPVEQRQRNIVATYDYRDESGELLFQVVRLDPKDFRKRRPDGRGGWLWNAAGVRPILYRLPGLVEHRRKFA